MHYLELALAIIAELIGTNLMKLSDGFSKLWFSVGTLAAYGFCFFFLALSLKGIKLNIAYATWGGAGIVLATLVSYFFFPRKRLWNADFWHRINRRWRCYC